MVHICNQREFKSTVRFKTCQYLYRFYFRMLAAPPLKHWTDSQSCGHSSIFAASHLIHHLLQALHHIVDCNSDTHIVLQKWHVPCAMGHVPWAMRHTRSPILVTWLEMDMPQGEFAFVLEILELPQTHHSVFIFPRGATRRDQQVPSLNETPFQTSPNGTFFAFWQILEPFPFPFKYGLPWIWTFFLRMEESFTCHSPGIPKIHVVYGWNKMARIK